MNPKIDDGDDTTNVIKTKNGEYTRASLWGGSTMNALETAFKLFSDHNINIIGVSIPSGEAA